MKTKSLNILLTILTLTALTSCKKFVEIDPPKTQLVTSNVFDNDGAAVAAQTALYAQMSSMTSIATLTGLSSDELINYGGNPYSALYQNGLSADDGTNLSALLWTPQYNIIYNANAVIEGLSGSPGLTQITKNQLTGEAKFIRAFWHFYLTNLYGNIPIVTTTNYNTNLELVRSPQAEVYKQIISDLLESINQLNDDYVKADNTTYPIATAERVRPNKWTAMALLSRVYLYQADYFNAEKYASLIIQNQSKYKLEQDLSKVFLKNSTEAIWQLMPIPYTGYNTDEGRKFILTAAPSTSNGVSLSDQQMNAFEAGDLRKNLWTGSFSANGKTYNFSYKYKVQTGNATVSEYSMVLRLAEQYLIRAESRVRLERITEGISDVNELRRRARAAVSPQIQNPLPALADNLTKDQALEAISHERRVELFTEADRWIDLKRTQQIDKVMEVSTPAKGGAKWKPYQQYYPIPVSDIQNSVNVKQTPGY